jgi:hypothetical protein
MGEAEEKRYYTECRLLVKMEEESIEQNEPEKPEPQKEDTIQDIAVLEKPQKVEAELPKVEDFNAELDL